MAEQRSKETARSKPMSDVDLARSMVVKLTLPNGDPHAFTLDDATSIDLDDLHEEIAGQARRYAVYAFLHVEVKDALRAAKGAVKEHTRRAGRAVRDELRREIGKEPTETYVRETIEGKPEYERLQGAVERLESLEDRLGEVRTALTQRRDMLQSAAMIRAPERGAPAGERSTYTRKNG